MKHILLVLLLPFLAFAQTEKGVSPMGATVRDAPTGQTYALVVGISDYQDENIPDLRFADRDAEEFANFLRSPAGGSLNDDHLKVLINDKATAGNIAAELYWLVDECKEGDQVIIYFSGHGDVEAKFRGQPGFLLCWDSPSRVYMSGGTVQLGLLQTVISTLSLDSKAKVTVITDACRSGKLAGSENNGSQLTNANLSQQYANETKILSCQPDEYSIEGEQWGGGRGAFSYHLIDGLYGMADGNEDLSVNLMEISRYLEDHVTAEVAPHSQIPMVVGSRAEKLTTVFPDLLQRVRDAHQGQLALFTPTESRGMEDEILAEVDTSVRKMYRLFKESLKDKTFLEPANACADFYYEQLKGEPKLERLHASMTRNYAAALQDDAQQVLNTILRTGLTQQVLTGKLENLTYKPYPAYLARAVELLGPEHYMYATLQARKSYFEGRVTFEREYFMQALKWQPDMPQALAELIGGPPDTAMYYAGKVMQVAPTWVVPYVRLYWNNINNNPDKAKAWLDQALTMDSSSALVWYEMAMYYITRNQLKKAVPCFEKAVAYAGEDICFPCATGGLGWLYIKTGQYEKAERQFLKNLDIDPNTMYAHPNLGLVYAYTGRFREAEQMFELGLKEKPDNEKGILVNYAVLYSQEGLPEKAFDYLERAFQKGFSYKEISHISIVTDPGLLPLRKQKERWNLLLKKYFPDYAGSYEAKVLADLEGAGEADLLNALSLDSTDHSLWRKLGLLYTLAGRWGEGEQMLKKAISHDSANALAWGGLGHIFAKTRRFNEAITALEKAISLDSTVRDLRNMLALTYVNAPSSEASEIEKHLQKSRTLLVPSTLDTQKQADNGPVTEKAISIHSITSSRVASQNECYTLDNSFMLSHATTKLYNPALFGKGIYPKFVNVTNRFGMTGSLQEITRLGNIDLFFFGTFLKNDLDMKAEEVDSLYAWSRRGGKMIIGGTAIQVAAILNDRWGFSLEAKPMGQQVQPTATGLNSLLFDGPFGKVTAANQGGTIQGSFNRIPENAIVLGVDKDGDPALILDCNTLDLIIADVDVYTSLGGISEGFEVSNANDRFWLNTIAYMDQLQGPPVVTKKGNVLSTGNDSYLRYQWLLNGEPVSGATDKVYVPKEPGTYSVQVSMSCGCNVTSESRSIRLTGEDDFFQLSQLRISALPDPDQLQLHFNIEEDTQVEMKMYDSSGQLIPSATRSAFFEKGDRSIMLDISVLPVGVYKIELVAGKDRNSIRFLK